MANRANKMGISTIAFQQNFKIIHTGIEKKMQCKGEEN
jgi:hypothetical protein